MNGQPPPPNTTPVSLVEIKDLISEGHVEKDLHAKIVEHGVRWYRTHDSVVELVLRNLIKNGHDRDGAVVQTFLRLAQLPERGRNSLRRLACGGAQDGENFDPVFGVVCEALANAKIEVCKDLTQDLLGWAYANTLGTGPQHAAPLDQPHHPFLDYLKMAPSDHHTLATLGAAWARSSVEEDEYGMADPAAATWMLDRLAKKGVNLGEVLRCVVANGGDDERQRFLIDTLLDRGAGDGLALGDLPQYPGKGWVLELLDSHPKSRRNLLAEIGGGGGREPGRGPKL